MVLQVKFNLIALILVPLTSCVELDLIDCGIDQTTEVSVGNVEVKQYPWLGVLYYLYSSETGETRAITTVALIHKAFVIGNAADIGPMPKINFRKQTRVLLGERWNDALGRRVRNYVLHPEYGNTYNTLALVQLKDPVRNKNLVPLCPPPEILRNPVFYVVKFNESYNILQKNVIPVTNVPSGLCKDFYVKANLYSKKMRPSHVVCAVSLEDEHPCVWDAGAALVAKDVWGRWLLLGVGVRGPGCGAPARFLDMSSYGPWVKQALGRFQRLTISKINKHKYVLRSSGVTPFGAYQRFGACDPEEKTNIIYREQINLRTDNMMYQFLTYNLTIRQSVEYTCLTMEMVNASAVSEMKVLHTCVREPIVQGVKPVPCYQYKDSVFLLSVYLVFSDTCMFEMIAWGFEKSMELLNIQKAKWEEGAHYEDFSMLRHEYRGQPYMTDFGFEPLDQKIWVPEYDIWTTTAFTEAYSPTTPLPSRYTGDGEPSTEAFVFIPSTTVTPSTPTMPRTKRTFKRKSTTTARIKKLRQGNV